MKRIRSIIRRFLPRQVCAAYDRYRDSKVSERHGKMSVEAAFTDIYANNRWGGTSGTFYSGLGSHESGVVSPYLAGIREELDRIGARSMTVIDLGCGDFSVGRHIAPHCDKYVGVDVVKPLIEHNRRTYGSPRVSFVHADIVADALPEGDVCFIRQVLQHLSNAEIIAILPKLSRYRWSFVTEHHPSDHRLLLPNSDKPHGGDIRASARSGVFLDQPPFNVPKNRYRLLLEVAGTALPGDVYPGVIRTFVLENDWHQRAKRTGRA